MKLAFFEGDTMLGVGYTNDPTSVHYLCPDCGNIWAREIVLDPENSPKWRLQHTSWSVRCPEHVAKWCTPPIFSMVYRPSWVTIKFPREVLERDFLLADELARRAEDDEQ